MFEKLILELTNNSYYWLKKIEDDGSAYLALFLTNDLGYRIQRIDSFKKNMRNDVFEGNGNRTYWEKENNTLIIGDLFEETLYENCFKISIQNMTEVLTQWEQLCHQKPPFIVIKEIDGKVILEANYSDDLSL